MAGAVFLSYASQDADAALRLCEALRAAGVEVWFDQSELRGGDAWDAKIRKQIRDCALFVPVISVNTQARPEGYFRLEWHLAEQRSHLIARGRPFIVPVAIDRTNDAEALVPDAFLAVQWMRVPGGEATPAFCERIKKLLGGESTGRDRPIPSMDPKLRSDVPSLPQKKVLAGLAPWAVGFAAILALAFWHPWHKAEPAPPAEATPASNPPATPPSEARQLVARARGLFEVLDATRDDFTLAEDLLVQAEAKDATDPEVWAAAAQLDQWYSLRGWDTSDARHEAARTAAQRALALDPQSFEVRLAQTGLLGDSGHEGVEKEKLLRQLREERPRDQRVLRSLATTMDRQGQVDEADALLDESAALPGGDPLALYDKSLNLWFVGRTAEAEAAIRAAIAQKPFAGALLISSWYQTVLHGDLAGARATLDQIPSIDFQEDRAAFFGYYVEYLRRDTDAALARLNAVPRDWLRDAWHSGPKSELLGDALHHGGRGDAAVTEWRAALKLVDSRLETDPADRGLLINRSLLLADLGERAEAERQFSVLLQMRGIDPAGVVWVPRWVTENCIALDRKAEAIQQIANSLKSERYAVDYTTAILRLDPTFDSLRGEPAFQKLILEAEAMEQASSHPPSVKAP
jgi:tetratricopeptide (TPR) repeat protein